MHTDLANVLRPARGRIRCVEFSPDDFKAMLSRRRIPAQAKQKIAREAVQIHIVHHPFVYGMGSVLDIAGTGGNFPRPASSGMAADTRAIASDWKAVGGDLRAVFEVNPPREVANVG